MKFAHAFEEALRQEGYPPHWLDSAIPYGALKKCLKRVQKELLDMGLDPETMRQLLEAQMTSSEGDSVPLAKYDFDAGGANVLRPRLTVIVFLKDGVAVDASLSKSTKAFLEKLAASQNLAGEPLDTSSDGSPSTSPSPPDPGFSPSVKPPQASSYISPALNLTSGSRPSPDELERSGSISRRRDLERVEVPLLSDCEFFSILRADVDQLDALQQRETEAMTRDIVELGREIAEVTKPTRYSKTDLSRWREIFDLYLDAQVFFSSTERERGARNSAAALQQLVWFQNEAKKRNLLGLFKLPASQQAYTRFLRLNATLLQNLRFQEINRTAVTKILKKFDKRTSLRSSGAFPTAVHSEHFLAESVARDICAQVSRDVVSVVPRLDDYICPVCLSIAWLPVRLDCAHVFCVRCVIKMQRENQRFCPLCRGEVVMKADLDNLDGKLEKFLKTYFRKETKEKQQANELERGIELFGESYERSSCVIM